MSLAAPSAVLLPVRRLQQFEEPPLVCCFCVCLLSPKRLRAADACSASLPPADSVPRSSLASAAAPPPQQQQQNPEEGQPTSSLPIASPELAAGTLGSLLSLHAQFHCDVCGADISGTFRIRCAECKDFDLCLSCFCSGRTKSSSGSSSSKQQQHKNSHAYIPVGRNRFPVFTLDWTAEEELLLVEGVSKYGFGNWLVSLIPKLQTLNSRQQQVVTHARPEAVSFAVKAQLSRLPEKLPNNSESLSHELSILSLGYHPLNSRVPLSSINEVLWSSSCVFAAEEQHQHVVCSVCCVCNMLCVVCVVCVLCVVCSV